MAAELVAFGDISVDIAVRIPRLPAPDEKLWVEVIGEYPGGMGANVSAAFNALGGHAALVASVGDDERGRLARSDLKTLGVDLSNVREIESPTFWTLALIGEGGEKSLLQFETPALAVPWATVDWSVLDGAKFAYSIGEEGQANRQLIEEAGRRGVRVALDIEPISMPQAALIPMLGGTDVVFTTPAGLASMGAPTDFERGAAWLLDHGTRTVAVTLGRDGCYVVTADAGGTLVPGVQVAPKDTTGAGDCFAGAFLLALCRDKDAVSAARIANAMAALSTTELGSRGRLASLDELRPLPGLKGTSLDWSA